MFNFMVVLKNCRVVQMFDNSIERARYVHYYPANECNCKKGPALTGRSVGAACPIDDWFGTSNCPMNAQRSQG